MPNSEFDKNIEDFLQLTREACEPLIKADKDVFCEILKQLYDKKCISGKTLLNEMIRVRFL